MNDSDRPSSEDSADDDAAVRLLRLAGPRISAPAVRASRVRTAVHQRWQAGRRKAVRRWPLAPLAVLATAAALILIAGRVIVHKSNSTTPGDVVGRVERIEGAPRRVSDEVRVATASSLAPEDAVRAGEWMETDANARASVRFSDGTSLRVDRATRVRPLSASVIELAAGAVYVDVGRAAAGLEVRTPVAVARDVGTQFEVRLLQGGLRLRVRTGVVELTDGRRSVSGRAGTEVALSTTGAVSRPFAPYGPEWEWATSLSPPCRSKD